MKAAGTLSVFQGTLEDLLIDELNVSLTAGSSDDAVSLARAVRDVLTAAGCGFKVGFAMASNGDFTVDSATVDHAHDAVAALTTGGYALAWDTVGVDYLLPVGTPDRGDAPATFREDLAMTQAARATETRDLEDRYLLELDTPMDSTAPTEDPSTTPLEGTAS